MKSTAASSKYIVITSPLAESQTFKKQLEDTGLNVFSYPSIEITRNIPIKIAKKYFDDFDSYDWILFTSRNGVRFFMDTIKELGIDRSVFHTKQIGVVGPKTAEEAKKYQLQVHFIPSEFTADDLASQLQDIIDKKILLPRSTIATPTLPEQLEKKGAIVISMPVYKTEFIATPNKAFGELLENDQIQCITFTSPSSIKGFLKSIADKQMKKKVFSLPVFVIGPITAKFAKRQGFQTIYTADTYTTEGIVRKVQESIL